MILLLLLLLFSIHKRYHLFCYFYYFVLNRPHTCIHTAPAPSNSPPLTARAAVLGMYQGRWS